MIFTHEHFQKDLVLEADLCVVGSGAGGSPVAYQAALQKKRVVVLEAGHYWSPRDFTQLEHQMFPRLFHDKGGRTTADKAIHVHQGKGVGGSTLHNINLCARLPELIERQWREDHGFRHLSPKLLDQHYATIEKALSVSTVGVGQINRNNLLFKRGVEKLKYRGGRMKHNRVGCVGSGFCEVGCAYDAKQNALKIFISAAVEAGAVVLADTWAAEIVQQGRKAVGVKAAVRHPETGELLHRVTIKAKAICLSASATGTPALLQRSQVPDPHRLVGSRLFLHPGVAVAGLFREPQHGWMGIPQSYECTEFLDFSKGSDKRVWLLPAFAHPVGASSILAGFGQEHERYFKRYAHMAAFSAMVHDETPGTVRPRGAFGVSMDYWPDARDRQQLALGLRESARIMQAAGAELTIIPLSKAIEIGPKDSIDATLRDLDIAKHDLNITAVHPMGSVWMGDDPKNSCVDSQGRYHHMDNLFVSDTSLFPTSIGVAPQLTTYTLGWHVGQQILTTL